MNDKKKNKNVDWNNISETLKSNFYSICRKLIAFIYIITTID